MSAFEKYKDAYLKDGYCLVKNVFSMEEVEAWRHACYEKRKEVEASASEQYFHGKAFNFLGGSLLAQPEFYPLVTDHRLVNLAATLLGGNPVYFGDSIFEIGEGGRGFHKDLMKHEVDEKDLVHPYPILRMGIYLQDHKDHSGGLKIRVGSNRLTSSKDGKGIIVPSQAGDVIVWMLSTTHAGNAVRLRFAPEHAIHNHRLEGRVPRLLRIPEQKERISFFLTYGLRGNVLDEYIEKMKKHRIYAKRIAATIYPEGIEDEMPGNLGLVKITS